MIYIVDGFILLGQKSLRKREKITSVHIQMGGLQNYTQLIAATSVKCLLLLPILIVRKITFHLIIGVLLPNGLNYQTHFGLGALRCCHLLQSVASCQGLHPAPFSLLLPHVCPFLRVRSPPTKV